MAVGKVVEAMFGGRFTVGLKVALVGLLQETLVLLVRKRGGAFSCWWRLHFGGLPAGTVAKDSSGGSRRRIEGVVIL